MRSPRFQQMLTPGHPPASVGVQPQWVLPPRSPPGQRPRPSSAPGSRFQRRLRGGGGGGAEELALALHHGLRGPWVRLQRGRGTHHQADSLHPSSDLSINSGSHGTREGGGCFLGNPWAPPEAPGTALLPGLRPQVITGMEESDGGAPDWVMGEAARENVSCLGRRPAAAPELASGGRGGREVGATVVPAHAHRRARPPARTSGGQSSLQDFTPPPQPVACVYRRSGHHEK